MRKIKVMGVIGGLVSILVLFGILFKAYDYFECRYALNSALAQTEKKVEQTQKDLAIHKLENYLMSLQQKIWSLEDRLEKKPNDVTAKKELREYKVLKVATEKQIDEIQRKP
jgi:hypothetical protein